MGRGPSLSRAPQLYLLHLSGVDRGSLTSVRRARVYRGAKSRSRVPHMDGGVESIQSTAPLLGDLKSVEGILHLSVYGG